jgi:polysaccharide biosynthesis/export protein
MNTLLPPCPAAPAATGKNRAPVRAIALVGLASLLTACGAAPGFRFDADATMPPVQAISAELLDAQEHILAVTPVDPRVAALAGVADTPYLIGPRDVLSISVWNHPELSSPALPSIDVSGTPANAVSAPAIGFQVDAAGMLTFPMVGQLAVTGMDTEKVRTALVAALARYIRHPELTVRVVDFRDRKVFVEGEVRMAGAKPITDVPMTLAQALSDAGGVTPNGDISQIQLTRAGLILDLDLIRLAEDGISAGNIPLHENDSIRVLSRDRKQVFVAGEIGRPSALPMLDGRMNLSEALASAGSVNPISSNPRSIYVIRPQLDGHPGEVFQLDAKSPTALALAARFALRPRDLVYVETAGLMRWSRVTSLLVPSSQALYNAQRSTDSR